MRGCLTLALCLLPAVGLAYSDATSFAKDPSVETSGGGGGLYFTGSPRQHGLQCSVCHINGPEDLTLRLSALIGQDSAPLFQQGYQPGQVYEIEVEFEGEDLAPAEGCEGATDEPCNINAFSFEVLDSAGQPAGTLCPVDLMGGVPGCSACRVPRAQGALVQADCSVLLADGFDATAFRWHNGARAYSFFWRAPEQDIGALLTYVSAVDGRGQETEDGEVTSYLNDRVTSVKVGLSSPSTPAPEASSCRTTGEGDVSLWILGLGLLMMRRRLRG